MLQQLVFLVVAVVGSLATCSVNASKTGCDSLTESSCTGVCTLYYTPSSCNGISGCNWKITGTYYGVNFGLCQSINATNISTAYDCEAKPDQTTCGADSMCNWQTRPCKFENACDYVGALNWTCKSLTTQAECTSSPGCDWGRCFSTTRCGMFDDQSSCVANSGCFWSESYRSSGNMTSKYCDACFTDSSNTWNSFLAFAARVGKPCTVGNSSVAFLRATSAASGCTGGVEPSYYAQYVCDGVDDSRGNSSSSGSNGLMDLFSSSSCVYYVIATVFLTTLLSC